MEYRAVPDDSQLSLTNPVASPDPEEQRLHLVALSRIRGLGEASLKALLGDYRSLAHVWDADPEELFSTLLEAGLQAPRNVVEQIKSQSGHLLDIARRDLDRLARQGIQVITDLDDAYPMRLRGLKSRPRWLFVQGDPKVLSMPGLIAVVGTRDATDPGLERARLLTRWLAERGCGIVAGLAEGIDQAAHEAALVYGAPTIGVLGTGILIVFPASTAHLRRRIIADGGAILTEYFPNETYSRARFVRRNRIQAGLAHATVPIEGAAASGTAHTYRFAREYGRVTFGVTRGQVSSENGILEVLRQDGQPIFDLNSEQSMAQLEELLRPILSATVKRPHPLRAFRSVIQEFERIVATYRPSGPEVGQLLMELEKVWERLKGDQSRHP
jgi:DNA protecting protein DprA